MTLLVVVCFSGYKDTDETLKLQMAAWVKEFKGEVRTDTPNFDSAISHVVVPDLKTRTMKALAARLSKRWCNFYLKWP